MFGIGMPEMILILAVALIVVGPKKLPELAKTMGKATREFKKATANLKESMKVDNEIDEIKMIYDDIETTNNPKSKETKTDTKLKNKTEINKNSYQK